MADATSTLTPTENASSVPAAAPHSAPAVQSKPLRAHSSGHGGNSAKKPRFSAPPAGPLVMAPAAPPYNAFIDKYGAFDNPMSGPARTAFIPLIDFLQRACQQPLHKLVGYLGSDVGKARVSSLFDGRSAYCGISKRWYANLKVSGKNAFTHKSPLDPKVALKQHLGRCYGQYLEPYLPLIVCHEDLWPVEPLFVANIQFPPSDLEMPSTSDGRMSLP